MATLERLLGVDHDDAAHAQSGAAAGGVARRPLRAARLPPAAAGVDEGWTTEALAQKLGARPETPAVAATGTAAPAEGATYVVRRGDTLSSIAARTSVSAAQLIDLNSLRDQDHIYEGQRLRLSGRAGRRQLDADPCRGRVGRSAVAESREETRAADVAEREAARAEPVSAAQAEAQSPTLLPGATSATAVDVFDYSVGGDDRFASRRRRRSGTTPTGSAFGATRLRDDQWPARKVIGA